MKKCFIIFALALFSQASELKIGANITAIKHSSNALYIGTDAGEVLKYDLSLKKISNDFFIKLPFVQNYYENNVSARIHSIDVYDKAFLLITEGDFGTQNLSLCENFRLKNGKCTTVKSPFANVKKAFFIDENTALLVLLSSDVKMVSLQDFHTSKAKPQISTIKEFKFSHTSLNDAVLDEKRQILLVASESGELQTFDLKAWKLLANYDKIHKDTLEQVDLKNKLIISCGKEKKLGLVRNGEQKFLQKNSLIYSCALSESATFAAFATNEAGKDITELIQTSNFRRVRVFDDVDFFAKFIVFVNENELLMINNNTILFRSIQ